MRINVLTLIHFLLLASICAGAALAAQNVLVDQYYNVTGSAKSIYGLGDVNTSRLCLRGTCYTSLSGATNVTVSNADIYSNLTSNGSNIVATVNLSAFDLRYALLSYLTAVNTTANAAAAGVTTVNATATGAVTVNGLQYTNITALQTGLGTVNTTATGAVTVNGLQYTNITATQAGITTVNATAVSALAGVGTVNTTATGAVTVNGLQYTNITATQAGITTVNTTAVAAAAAVNAVRLNVTDLQTSNTSTNFRITSLGAVVVLGDSILGPLDDASGSGNTAAAVGTPTYNVAGYYDLSGSGAYLEVSNSTVFSPYANGNVTTLSVWFKPNTDQVGDGSNGRQVILGKGGTSNYEYQLYRSNGTNPDIAFQTYSLDGSVSDNVVLDPDYVFGRWYHVAVVMNGTHAIGYVNGVNTANMSITRLNGIGAAPLQIGNRNSAKTFNGSIDEVKIYAGTALSASDVLTLFNNGSVTSGLVAYYPFVNNTNKYLQEQISALSTFAQTKAATGATTCANGTFVQNVTLTNGSLTTQCATDFGSGGSSFDPSGLYTNVTGVQAGITTVNATAVSALTGVGTVNTTATGAVTVNGLQYTNITGVQAGITTVNATAVAKAGTGTASCTDNSTHYALVQNLTTTTGAPTSVCVYISKSGGTGTPGGSSADIQYNNAGSLGGATGFTYGTGGITLSDQLYFDNGDTRFGSNASAGQFVIGVGGLNGGGIILGTKLCMYQDYDRTNQSSPAMYFHSSTCPNVDNTQYGKIQHNGSRFGIESGNGSVSLGNGGNFYLNVTAAGIVEMATAATIAGNLVLTNTSTIDWSQISGYNTGLVNESHLNTTNTGTAGQVLSLTGTAGQFTWITPSAGGGNGSGNVTGGSNSSGSLAMWTSTSNIANSSVLITSVGTVYFPRNIVMQDYGSDGSILFNGSNSGGMTWIRASDRIRYSCNAAGTGTCEFYGGSLYFAGSANPALSLYSDTLNRTLSITNTGAGEVWVDMDDRLTVNGSTTTASKELTVIGSGNFTGELCFNGDSCLVANKYMKTQKATTNNTVYTLIPDLAITLPANGNYTITCSFITFSAASTTGEQMLINSTGSPTAVTWSWNSQVSATTTTSLAGTSTSSNAFADSGSAGTNVRDTSDLVGFIQTSGSASTLSFEVKTEVAGSNAAFDTGSTCRYMRLG